jgi:hypothetical protein
VKRVDLVGLEVREAGMIAELVRRQRIRTLARHDDVLVSHEEAPPRIADHSDVEAQHVSVVTGRWAEIMDRDHLSRVAGHRAVLAMESTFEKGPSIGRIAPRAPMR